MWRLSLAIRPLEALTKRQHARMTALHIDDDVALALRLLRKAGKQAV